MHHDFKIALWCFNALIHPGKAVIIPKSVQGYVNDGYSELLLRFCAGLRVSGYKSLQVTSGVLTSAATVVHMNFVSCAYVYVGGNFY